MTIDTAGTGPTAPTTAIGKAAPRQRHARWPHQWLVPGAIGVTASFFWPPLYQNPSLVLLGQDQQVWSWLVAVASGLATGIGLLGIAHNLSRNHDAWWQGILLTLFSSGVVVLLCVAAIPALIFGALTFGNSYRDLGNSHGNGTVVALHPSNGYSDSELVFGTRRGIWVDFDPRTRRVVADDATLSDWSFALTTTPTTTEVHATSTGTPSTGWTVTLTRTDTTTPDTAVP